MVAPIIQKLPQLMGYRRRGAYPTHVHYRVLLPVGADVSAVLYVPDGYVYIVPGEVHDVPADVFTHKCIKDGRLILPETLIDGTSMIINYPQPVVVWEYWHGTARNVSDIYSPPGTDAVFRLRVPLLVAPEDLVGEAERISEMEEGMMLALLEAWARMGPAERAALAERLMREAPLALAAMAIA